MCKHEECLKGEEHDPKGCAPELIRECHGDIDVEEHPCEAEIRRRYM